MDTIVVGERKDGAVSDAGLRRNRSRSNLGLASRRAAPSMPGAGIVQGAAMSRSRRDPIVRWAIAATLAAAQPALAFDDKDFCSAARQFAAAVERDVGVWIDRATRNGGMGVFCERKSVEFWHFTYAASASMDEAWRRRKSSDWNAKQCASPTWGDAIRHGWKVDLVVTSADRRQVAFTARCE